MAEFKLVISDPKTGRSMQKVAPEAIASQLIGKKIGDTIKGELFDMTGVELLITGGSDNAGFPMRKDVRGGGRKKILIVAYHGNNGGDGFVAARYLSDEAETDILFIGDESKLKKEALAKRGIKVKIVRLAAFEPERYKSSLIGKG